MDLHPSYWPPELVCPISRSVMADPVIITSGETYERRCIEAWLELGQNTCLKQNTSLTSAFMIPNMAVKNAIANLAKSRRIQVFPISPSHELAHALAQRLISEMEASRRMTGLSPSGPSNESTLANQHSPDGNDNDKDDDNGEDIGVTPHTTASVHKEQISVSKGEIVSEAYVNAPLSHAVDEKLMAHEVQLEKSNPSVNNAKIEDENKPRPRPYGGPVTWSSGPSSQSHGLHQKGNSFHTFGKYHTFEGNQVMRNSQSTASETPANRELPPDLATRPASYRADNPDNDHHRISDSAEPENRLIQKLRDPEQQGEAVAELRQLTRTSAESRISLCCPAIIQAILPLLRSPVPEVQVNGVAALVNFSIEKQNKVSIVRAGAIPYIVSVLNASSHEAQEHAAGAVFSLALADENKNPFGVLNAIPPLIQLLHSGTPRACQDAAMALYHLSLYQSNKSKLVKLGAVPILLDLAESHDKPDLASRSLLILINIAAVPEGRASILELNGIVRLVRLLAIQSSREAADIPEQAAAVLLLLSQGNMRFKSIALKAGAQELLMALADDGASRAREKALALLAILKERSAGQGGEDSMLPSHYFRRNMGRADGMNSSAF